MAFAIEEIPNEAGLFRKVHHTHYDERTGVVSSAAFKQEQMSVNWEKYRTAEASADANSAAVVALVAGDCRGLGQSVEHTPVGPDQLGGPNQAHAEVRGKKTNAISHKLRDKAQTVWLRICPAGPTIES
jgi:hypothetical protein